MQKAAFELEQQMAYNDKSQKRISGADSQANVFLKLSIARRAAEQEEAEKGVETLRQNEEKKVRTRLASEQAKADAKEAAANVDEVKKEAAEKEAAGKEAEEAAEKAEAETDA